MRHAPTPDEKLNKLGFNLDYWRWKYESCYQFHNAEYYKKYQEARKEFGDYYRVTYSTAKPIQETKDYVRLADLTEIFEEYENY